MLNFSITAFDYLFLCQQHFPSQTRLTVFDIARPLSSRQHTEQLDYQGRCRHPNLFSINEFILICTYFRSCLHLRRGRHTLSRQSQTPARTKVIKQCKSLHLKGTTLSLNKKDTAEICLNLYQVVLMNNSNVLQISKNNSHSTKTRLLNEQHTLLHSYELNNAALVKKLIEWKEGSSASLMMQQWLERPSQQQQDWEYP